MKVLHSVLVVSIFMFGCENTKLDNLVGDYNAQLAAVREASMAIDKNIEADEAAPGWQWRNVKFKEASDKAFELVHSNMKAELAKAIQLRKDLESEMSFKQNYRYNQYLEGERWSKVGLEAQGEEPLGT